jgi:hypothetical protein
MGVNHQSADHKDRSQYQYDFPFHGNRVQIHGQGCAQLVLHALNLALTQRHSAAKPQPKELDVGVEQHLAFAEIFSRVIDSRV